MLCACLSFSFFLAIRMDAHILIIFNEALVALHRDLEAKEERRAQEDERIFNADVARSIIYEKIRDEAKDFLTRVWPTVARCNQAQRDIASSVGVIELQHAYFSDGAFAGVKFAVIFSGSALPKGPGFSGGSGGNGHTMVQKAIQHGTTVGGAHVP